MGVGSPHIAVIPQAFERALLVWARSRVETLPQAILLPESRQSRTQIDRPDGEPVQTSSQFGTALNDVNLDLPATSDWQHLDLDPTSTHNIGATDQLKRRGLDQMSNSKSISGDLKA